MPQSAKCERRELVLEESCVDHSPFLRIQAPTVQQRKSFLPLIANVHRRVRSARPRRPPHQAIPLALPLSETSTANQQAPIDRSDREGIPRQTPYKSRLPVWPRKSG